MQHRFIVYEREGADPRRDRISFTRGDCTVTIVAVPLPETIIDSLAQQLVAEGATSIELCGGTSARIQAQLIQVMGDKVPVSGVSYNFESLTGVAEYKHRFEIGDAPFKEAFIIGLDGSDPTADIHVKKNDMVQTTFVCVPHNDMALTVAADLAANGVQLIELYNITPKYVESIIEKTGDGKVPIGVLARWPMIS